MNSKTNEQQAAFKKLSKLKVGALFMEMGTGKTRVALDLINSKKDKVNYILWVCPYSLKNEIEAERQKWQPDLQIDIIGCESIGSSSRIYLETLEKVKSHKSFIIVDESLKIKNIRAKRTQRIIQMGDNAKYKLILNGTPLSKNVLDVWSQMEFLSPKILNMSYVQFKDTYCEYYVRGKLKGKVKDQYNIPHLIAKIEPYIFDCDLEIETKKDYSKCYYHINNFPRYVDYKNKIFDDCYYAQFDKFNFNAFAIKLQKYYCDYENNDKQKTLKELTEQINDKVIVFVRFLSAIPDGEHKIIGDTPTAERAQTIKDFADGKFNVLYITYGCGAYGLNLQFCKNIIFAEHSWDYAQRIQAEARIYRIGQGKKVNYYDLICDDTGLEKLILDCIDKKADLSYTVKSEIAKLKGGAKEWVKSI